MSIVIFVDVDDTLVRYAGTKRIPIVSVIEHVRKLSAEGFSLYCWSTGGKDYAESVARELKLDDCFSGFLPKPNVLIDDQTLDEWKKLICIHPLDIHEHSSKQYLMQLNTK